MIVVAPPRSLPFSPVRVPSSIAVLLTALPAVVACSQPAPTESRDLPAFGTGTESPAATSPDATGSNGSVAADGNGQTGGAEGPLPAERAPMTGAAADGSCGAGRVACGGTCTDLRSDGQHGGACDNPCPDGLVCSAGECASGCVSNLSSCGGSCVDTLGSPEHCGGCDAACPEDQTCLLGGCRCPSGQAACDGSCGDVLSNLTHCGSCGNACAADASCVEGQCVCPDFGIDCSGTCRAVFSDESNCGSCGNTCGGGTQCLFGGCLEPNDIDCGGGTARHRPAAPAFAMPASIWDATG